MATYDYVDEEGRLLFQVARDDKKDFYPRRRNVARDPKEPEWLYGLADVRRVLYRLPEVKSAVALGLRVFVCEGEKDADSVCALGLVATTNAGGVGMGWTDLHAEMIAGAKEVTILADNDDPGRAHAEKVRKLLHGKVGRVRVLELPGLPVKGDVSDWIAAGGTREKLEELAACGPESRGWISSTTWLKDGIPETDWIVDGLIARPSLCMVSGDADSFKSWSLTQLCMCAPCGWRWFAHFPINGARAMLVSSDEHRSETLRKIAWMAKGEYASDEDLALMGKGFLVWTDDLPFDDEPTFARLLQDVEDFRPDIVVVDHLRVAFDGSEDESEFARKVKMRGRAIHAVHPCAVIWIHHHRKLAKEKEMNAVRQRVRGTGGLVQAFDHHIAFEREEDSDISVVIVDRQKLGPRLPPFSIKGHFSDSDGMAWVKYEGDPISLAGSGESPGALLQVLQSEDRAWTPLELTTAMPDVSRRTIQRALSGLAGARLITIEGNGKNVSYRASAPSASLRVTNPVARNNLGDGFLPDD